jgi:sodium-independent sulfate anion transporter 11
LEIRARQLFEHVYIEEDPTIKEELIALVPSSRSIRHYFQNLFPFVDWLPRYNIHWLLGDALAGLTVGLVVVPQAMAYAILARLSPEHGLYTSFSGAAIYWMFGTSKDIVIGVRALSLPPPCITHRC